jgi:DHA1 family bicyclomycin/chloramphenicol resistance-like MFS transporter
MIFAAFILFCLIATTWLALRQPETLPPERRRPFAPRALWQATQECFSHRIFTLSTATQALTFGILFATLSTIQPVFDDTFGREDSFPSWFALIAVIGGTASIVNAWLVVALGMRSMIQVGLGGLALLSAVVAIVGLTGAISFTLFMIWATAIFFMVGLVIGNLNALAMEPLGHVAGLAASVIGATSTVLGVAIAIPIGLVFNGTPIPLAIGLTVLSLLGFLLIRLGLR